MYSSLFKFTFLARVLKGFFFRQSKTSTILRIIEVIGQDELSTLDEDTLFFIISALNQLNIDSLRNKILLKVLPLKV